MKTKYTLQKNWTRSYSAETPEEAASVFAKRYAKRFNIPINTAYNVCCYQLSIGEYAVTYQPLNPTVGVCKQIFLMWVDTFDRCR